MLADPGSPRGERPLDRWYGLELRAEAADLPDRIGGRVYARFDHGAEPIAWRLWRVTRQLLLQVLHV